MGVGAGSGPTPSSAQGVDILWNRRSGYDIRRHRPVELRPSFWYNRAAHPTRSDGNEGSHRRRRHAGPGHHLEPRALPRDQRGRARRLRRGTGALRRRSGGRRQDHGHQDRRIGRRRRGQGGAGRQARRQRRRARVQHGHHARLPRGRRRLPRHGLRPDARQDHRRGFSRADDARRRLQEGRAHGSAQHRHGPRRHQHLRRQRLRGPR